MDEKAISRFPKLSMRRISIRSCCVFCPGYRCFPGRSLVKNILFSVLTIFGVWTQMFFKMSYFSFEIPGGILKQKKTQKSNQKIYCLRKLPVNQIFYSFLGRFYSFTASKHCHQKGSLHLLN